MTEGSNLTDLIDSVHKMTSGVQAEPVQQRQEIFTPADPTAPPPASYRDLEQQIPGELDGTDPDKHGELIGFLAQFAVQHGGVKTVSDLQDWLHRQFGHANRSGYRAEDSRFVPPEPEIVVLTNYLRQPGMPKVG